MSLVLGGLDVVGDDDTTEGEGLVTLGAARRVVRVATPRWMRGATSQGVSRPQEELDFLPFELVSLAAAGDTGVLIARPQRPFRGERLVMERTGAGDAVIDPAIFVGAVQVGASQGAAPVSAFSSESFGVRMSFPAAGQGTEIKIFVRAITVPGPDPLVVTAVLFGRTMR
jgi:hypothetical protein